MNWMKSSDIPIILNSEVNLPALRVCQADDGGDQFAVA